MKSPSAHTQSQGRLQSAKPYYSRGGGLNRYSSMKPQDLKAAGHHYGDNKSEVLTEERKNEFDRMSGNAYGQQARPMSAATRSTVNSYVSRLPEMNRMKMMMIVEAIFKNRSAITDVIKT